MEDDVTLALLAARGDRAAFGTLYDRHVRAVYRYLFYRTFDREQSEDLTAQVFVKALERIRSFTPRSAHGVLAWFYTIARTTMIDSVRKSGRTVELGDDVAAPSQLSDVEASIDIAQVRKALESLPETQREVILLRVWEERSYEEIAAIVGKTPANAKVIFSRGLKALRNQLPLAVFISLFLHL